MLKKTVSLFAGVVLSVTAGALVASPVWDAEGECAYLNQAVCAAEAAHSGSKGFAIRSGTTAYLTDFVEIDPGLQYELSGWLRAGSDEPVTANFGMESYDKDKILIKLGEVQYNHSTLSQLVEDANPGDSSILIAGSLVGYTGHSFMPVAFNAKEDFSDLPNRDQSPNTLAVRPEEAGIRVTFEKPLTNSYPKGTMVRQHNRIGGAYQWAGFSDKPLTREWQEYRKVIRGGSTHQTKPDLFRPGTRYVRLVLQARGGKDGLIHADDLALRPAGSATPEPYVHEPFFLVKLDRLTALYRCGDMAEFTVARKLRGLQEIQSGTLTVVFTLDGGRKIAEHNVDLAAQPGPIVFRQTLNEPGFLRCMVTYHDGTKPYGPRTAVAAGFNVEDITPGDPVPADLVSYWHGELSKLDKEVPFDLSITQEKEDRNFAYYRLSGAHFGGTRITAGLTIPKTEGPFPVRITVPGAGNTSTPCYTFPQSIGLSVSVFDRIFGPGDYEAFNSPQWYFYKGAESRETYYYYKSILGAMRMVSYVMTRPEWDRKNLWVSGFSQGGGFALILGGLFADHVTGVAAGAPALCDHNGRAKGRTGGWPQLIGTHSNVVEYARYYDAALFAAHIKCPTIISVGFIDTMCVPSSVYAAYNGIKADKRIFNAPLYGHGSGVNSPEFGDCLKDFFDKLLTPLAPMSAASTK